MWHHIPLFLLQYKPNLKEENYIKTFLSKLNYFFREVMKQCVYTIAIYRLKTVQTYSTVRSTRCSSIDLFIFQVYTNNATLLQFLPCVSGILATFINLFASFHVTIQSFFAPFLFHHCCMRCHLPLVVKGITATRLHVGVLSIVFELLNLQTIILNCHLCCILVRLILDSLFVLCLSRKVKNIDYKPRGENSTKFLRMVHSWRQRTHPHDLGTLLDTTGQRRRTRIR